MTDHNFPGKATVSTMALIAGDKHYPAAISWLLTEEGSLPPLALKILSEEEEALMPDERYGRRRHDIVAGRIAAKSALAAIMPLIDPLRVSILPGVMGQPVVTGPDAHRFGVTISHTGNAAVAISFTRKCPVGVDIEQIDLSSYQALARHSILDDVEAMSFALRCDDVTALTAIWCAKEALSKLLGCGMAADPSALQTASVQRRNGFATAGFARFSGFQAFIAAGLKRCIAIALPPSVYWRGEGHCVLSQPSPLLNDS